MKKATSKRERKWGKKAPEEPVETDKPREVKVIVDGYSILKFKSLDRAQEYIDKKTKEAESKRRKPTSYIIV